MEKIKKSLWLISIFILILMIFSTRWVLYTYNNGSFEQILFHLTQSIKGVETTILNSYLTECLLLTTIEFIILIYMIKKIKIIIKKEKNIKYIKISLVVVLLISIFICTYKVGAIEYFVNGQKNSTFIEDNYVEPEKVNISFPKKKKNLIYIYVESLESTYYSLEQGGQQKENLMPELYELSKNNISFSDTEKMGGAYQINGTSWTTAGLVAQTSGMPLKMPKLLTNETEIVNFLDNTYTLGEILEKEGYNQTIMFGSDGNFGNRLAYFQTNGNYLVYDYYSAIQDKKIDANYKVWWGYEDSKLFEYAKEEVTKLSNEKQPFNLTLLTSNTHHVDGYLEDSCKKEHKKQYANVIACSSYQINEFINWCKQQEFYENTTIIIMGDHLSMNPKFFITTDDDKRRIFNLFINSSQEATNTKNRKFSTIDLFPTTLAALGATIEGNKLALGTNLFSEEQTLIEKYGIDKVNKELKYKSEFYNNKILDYDK